MANDNRRKRKQRGNGEGSIYRRKSDGRWVGSITLGYVTDPETGKRKRLSKTIYGSTQKEVREELDKLRVARSEGRISTSGRMTVREYLNRWLEDVVKPNFRKNTHVNYEVMVRLHINPRIGDVKMEQLTPLHVQQLYKLLGDDGVGDRTRQLCHSTLHRALKIAARQGLIARNPCEAVDRPQYEKGEMKVLTSTQAYQLIEASKGDRYHALIVLAITTGLRQGELFGLQWDDVDMENRKLTVRRTLIEVKGKHEYGPPKSKAGVRNISLSQLDVDALNEHRAIRMKEGHLSDPLIFSDNEGNPIRKSNFMRRYYKPLLKAAQLPNIRFHDLRHTSATMLLEARVHPKIVQERLGHSQISMTLDTYSHVIEGMDQQAADVFDTPVHRTNAG